MGPLCFEGLLKDFALFDNLILSDFLFGHGQVADLADVFEWDGADLSVVELRDIDSREHLLEDGVFQLFVAIF